MKVLINLVLWHVQQDGERVEGEVYWLLSDFSAINEVVDSIANEVCNILSGRYHL